jgi:hypothetical protein
MKVMVNNEWVIVHENARVIDAVQKYLADNKKLNLGSVLVIEDNFGHTVSPYGSVNNGDNIKVKFT